MRANNSLQARGNKPKFSVAIQTPMYQKLVNDTLGDPERAAGSWRPSAPPWRSTRRSRRATPERFSLPPCWVRA